ncbi:hypothetical protein [Halomonas huangheensis]|uniref:CBS domain-containing protein n=1 Tax=Halomonas huangheensis TaxID=1178482 RepID=W1NCC6_9GAMM|nr:hypothetical protein [Halomonas huangheensis]ALM54035.1 hypothetical protein AR456_18460 [Halomonas huangheensis]ERL52585.1 hypothetical protein BJB45_08510 [Halomonas huangheensis]
MKTLPLSKLDTADHLVTPQQFDDIDQDSPALSLMTDFRQHRPHAVGAAAPALGVARLMATEEVDSKLVVDHHRELIGLLTRERLSEQSLLVAQVTMGIDRESLTAADLMLPRNAMPALDYRDLERATVADLVATLQEAGEPYCLVRDQEHQQIRGLISMRELSERLHQQLSIKPKASVLKVLNQALN